MSYPSDPSPSCPRLRPGNQGHPPTPTAARHEARSRRALGDRSGRHCHRPGGRRLACLCRGQRPAARPRSGPTSCPPTRSATLELRLDLPADQRANARRVPFRFPGWADPAAFDTEASPPWTTTCPTPPAGRVVPSRDIAPWFDGRVALGITELPRQTNGIEGTRRARTSPGWGSRTAAALEATIERFRTESDADGRPRNRTPATIATATIGTDAVRASRGPSPTSSCSLARPGARCASALDVLSGATPSLADAPTSQPIYRDVPDGRLASTYVDIAGAPRIPGRAAPAASGEDETRSGSMSRACSATP